MTAPLHDKILIIDFGSQVTQLLAPRVREVGASDPGMSSAMME